MLLTKNALEHVHLEDESVQNQLLIAGGLDFLPLNSFSKCVESRRSLDNAAIMSLPQMLSASGGEWRSGRAWTLDFCVMIGGSAKG